MDSDFLKGINKAIDAAEGRTGTEYQYKYHTDTTEALDRLAEAITAGGGGGGGASSLEDLTDVDISGTPQGGAVLKYNSVENKWTPGDDSGNVQANWNESNPSSGAYIQNKPTIPAAQIQADWNEDDTTSMAYIQNKPTIPQPEPQVQADWNEDDSTDPAYIQNKPTIPAAQVNSDWNAVSGVAQILNKPTIPAAQVQSDWTEADSTSPSFIKNKPSIPSGQVQSDWNEDDSTDPSYIQNKPTIPAEQVRSDWNEDDTTAKSYILNKPTIPNDISDLGDVNITSPSNNDILKYDSTNQEWVNGTAPSGSSTLSGLDDVTITSVQNDQVIKYDSTTSKWVNASAPSGSSTLSGLTDVTITNPSFHQQVVYDSTNQIWVNGNLTRVLTQLEYDALSQAEKMNGTIYFVNNADPEVPEIGDLEDVTIDTTSLEHGQAIMWDSTKHAWVNGDPASDTKLILSGTLPAYTTTLTLSNAGIKADSFLIYSTEEFGVYPVGATVTNGSVTMTFEERTTSLAVKVWVVD